MTLQTHVEETLVQRVERIERAVIALLSICKEIQKQVEPDQYPATDAVTVMPEEFRHRYPR